MNRTQLQARITAIYAQIEAFEGAILAFAENGAIQEYDLDTGQTQTKVKRADLASLRTQLKSLYNLCTILEARLNGAAIIGRPAR